MIPPCCLLAFGVSVHLCALTFVHVHKTLRSLPPTPSCMIAQQRSCWLSWSWRVGVCDLGSSCSVNHFLASQQKNALHFCPSNVGILEQSSSPCQVLCAKSPEVLLGKSVANASPFVEVLGLATCDRSWAIFDCPS